MLWSAFTLAYSGLLRGVKIFRYYYSFNPTVNLSVADVKIYDENPAAKYMTVLIQQSKTQHSHKGVKVFIGCSSSSVCAMTQ